MAEINYSNVFSRGRAAGGGSARVGGMSASAVEFEH